MGAVSPVSVSRDGSDLVSVAAAGLWEGER